MIPATPTGMLFFLLAQAFSLLLDLIWLGRRADHDKDVEILLLRQQLRILQRKQPRPPRISRWEKLTLLVLAGKLTATDDQRPQPPQSGRAPVQARHAAEVAPRACSAKMDLQEEGTAGPTANRS